MPHFEPTTKRCRWCHGMLERYTDPSTQDVWLVCTNYPGCRYQEPDHA